MWQCRNFLEIISIYFLNFYDSRLAAEEEGYDNAMEVEEDDSRGRADYSYSSFSGGDSAGDNKAGQTGGGSRGNNSTTAEKKRGSVSV